jgi:hypothetical protein
MKTVYLSIIIAFCASISVSAQIQSSFFADTNEPNMSYFGYSSEQLFYAFPEQTPANAEPFSSTRSGFGDGWLDMPDGMGNAQKVPVGGGLGILILIALSYISCVFVKLRRDKFLKEKQ